MSNPPTSKKTFTAAYEDESDAIFRFCLLRVSDRDQALDLTQETFVRLWQSLTLGHEMTNMRAFLFTVAHRLIIDWYRKKKSVSLENLSSGDDDE
ncbi:MAG: RNA polymerase sigma factor, partial [Patescibacteria group bacterium]|nr:RNA polymerase sigma factor [Patescibacteria group bacterium]